MPMQHTEIVKVVKIENFQKKSLYIFLIFAQNRDCGYMLEPPQRGTHEYPQFMFWSKNKKNWHTPAYSFFIVKNLKFHYKCFDIFLIFAQNIDCGYTF